MSDAGNKRSCLYCGGSSEKVVFEGVQDRLKFAPGEWSFYQCGNCRSAVIDPFPDPKEIPGFYPPEYDFNTQSRSAFGRWLKNIEYRFFFRQQYKKQASFILRRVGLRSGKGLKMLDAGCGHGLRLKEFSRLGFEVSGSDINASAVSYVQQTLRLPAVISDSADLLDHFARQSLDLVVSFYMIEHVPDVHRRLQVFGRLLKPGGYLVLATLLIESQQSRFWGRKWSGVTEAPRHLSIPSAQGLRHACRQAGFTQVYLLPDNVLTCTGVWLLSLFPVLGRRSAGALPRPALILLQILALVMGIAIAPWCWIENHVLNRPALVLVFAVKE